jgi:hypothetical protein
MGKPATHSPPTSRSPAPARKVSAIVTFIEPKSQDIFRVMGGLLLFTAQGFELLKPPTHGDVDLNRADNSIQHRDAA